MDICNVIVVPTVIIIYSFNVVMISQLCLVSISRTSAITELVLFFAGGCIRIVVGNVRFVSYPSLHYNSCSIKYN